MKKAEYIERYGLAAYKKMMEQRNINATIKNSTPWDIVRNGVYTYYISTKKTSKKSLLSKITYEPEMHRLCLFLSELVPEYIHKPQTYQIGQTISNAFNTKRFIHFNEQSLTTNSKYKGYYSFQYEFYSIVEDEPTIEQYEKMKQELKPFFNLK